MVSIFRIFKLTSSYNPDINVLHCFTNFIWPVQWNIFHIVSYVAVGMLVVVGLGFLKENISIAGIEPPKSGAGIVNIGGTNLNIQSQRIRPFTRPIVVQPTPLWQRRLSSHASSLESNGVDSSISTHVTSDLLVSHDLNPLSISTGNLSSNDGSLDHISYLETFVAPLTEIGEKRFDYSKSIATLVLSNF